jgi:general L-amino acid transport system permease protein
LYCLRVDTGLLYWPGASFRKLAPAETVDIYIETFRNIPPLLQIFFWYFAVLRNLPGPRQAVDAFELFFLSNRGLYIPLLSRVKGCMLYRRDCDSACPLCGLFRYNRKHQIKTGQLRKTWPTAAPDR